MLLGILTIGLLITGALLGALAKMENIFALKIEKYIIEK